MSKFVPGTLVMLKAPSNHDFIKEAPRNGAIGVVGDPTKWLSELAVGEVVVQFGRHPSPQGNGWKVLSSWLILIGGPGVLDTDEEDDNPYVVKQPMEEVI